MDDNVGCAAALWMVWRLVVGDDRGCLTWLLIVIGLVVVLPCIVGR
ncbi:MAG: hypothetical protein ABFE07_10870 [Armatimonadia bacterium]